MQVGEILQEHHAIVVACLDRVAQAGRIDPVERVHRNTLFAVEGVIFCHNLVNAVKISLHGILVIRQCGETDIICLFLKELLYKFGIAACYNEQGACGNDEKSKKSDKDLDDNDECSFHISIKSLCIFIWK